MGERCFPVVAIVSVMEQTVAGEGSGSDFAVSRGLRVPAANPSKPLKSAKFAAFRPYSGCLSEQAPRGRYRAASQ